MSLSTRLAWFLPIALIGFALDRYSKAWVEELLLPRPGRSMMLIDPWLEFGLAYNHGTAFSAIRDLGSFHWFFAMLAFIFALGILVWIIKTPQLTKTWLVCLGLVAAGGLGNGIDRLLGRGVVDFVVVNYPWGGSYPTWNVADAFIVVGSIILMALLLRAQPPAAGENVEGGSDESAAAPAGSS